MRQIFIKFSTLVSISLLLSLFMGCQKEVEPDFTFEISSSSLSFDGEAVAFPASGETIVLNFVTDNTTHDWEYRIPSGDEWLTATKSGSKLTIVADANETDALRKSTISFIFGDKSQTVQISQEAVDFSFELNSDSPLWVDGSVPFPTIGGTLDITFSSTTDDYEWDYALSEGADWFTIDVTGDDITLTADANDSGSPRSATITITYGTQSSVINLSKESIDVGFTLTSDSPLWEDGAIEYQPTGGDVALLFTPNTAGQTVNFEIPSEIDWLEVNIEEQQIAIVAQENGGAETRTTTVTIVHGNERREISISQLAFDYSFILESSSSFWSEGTLEFSSTENSAEINFTPTTLGHSWTVEVSQEASSWLNASKSDNDIVISVNENSDSSPRSGTVTVTHGGHYSQNIEVTQDHKRSITLSSNNITLKGKADTQSVEIESDLTGPFSTEVDGGSQSWLTAEVAGTVLSISATQNPSEDNSRSGTVTISGVVTNTGEVITAFLDVTQNPFAGLDYYFEIPDFSQSEVYKVMDGNKEIAQICREFLKGDNVLERAVVVYPINKEGEVELSEGYVAQVLLRVDGAGDSQPVAAVHGGKVAFDKALNSITEYQEGSASAPVTVVYKPAEERMGSEEVEGSVLATVEPDLIDDQRGSEVNSYPIVKIGTQYWMGKNLNTTKYNENRGFEDIPNNIALLDWREYHNSKNYSPGCAVLNHVDANSSEAAEQREKLGVLYSFYTINGAPVDEAQFDTGDNLIDNISPTGWSVPMKSDFEELRGYILEGVASAAMRRLRAFLDEETGQFINYSDKDDENITGFTARRGTRRTHLGTFQQPDNADSRYFLWARTKGATDGKGWSMNGIGVYEQDLMNGFSIRCIKK